MKSNDVLETDSSHWAASVCWVNAIPIRVSIQLSDVLSTAIGVRKYYIGSEAYHTRILP